MGVDEDASKYKRAMQLNAMQCNAMDGNAI